jgi:hypothetical protein
MYVAPLLYANLKFYILSYTDVKHGLTVTEQHSDVRGSNKMIETLAYINTHK